MERLELVVAHCSSEEPHFPAAEMVRQGPAVPRGWHSAANCEYPQVVGLRFLVGEVNLSRMQFVANDCRIPSKVEVHFASLSDSSNETNGGLQPFHSAKFRSAGYFNFRSNKDAAFRTGELKVVSVEEPVLYIKLVINEPHPHPLNPFNQVGIVSAVALGSVRKLSIGPSVALNLAALEENTSLLHFFRGGASRDMTVDAQVVDKIAEMENAKLKMIMIEDFESARRIRDQLEELQPLGVCLLDLEHKKRKAIAEENYSEAHKMKVIIQRIRTYVGSLKPGMPYQRIDIQAMVEAEDTVESNQILTPLKSGATPFIRKPKHLQFDEIPVCAEASPSRRDVAEVHAVSSNAEVQLLVADLAEADRSLATLVRDHMPTGSNDWHPERVSDDRSSSINGWKKMVEVFGLYLSCCLFSKRFQFREAAFSFMCSVFRKSEMSSIHRLCEQFGRSEIEVRLAILYALSPVGNAVSDAVPSVFFHAAELCRFLLIAQGTSISKDASQKSLLRQICKNLAGKLGDSNSRVRQSVDETIHTFATVLAAGYELICDVIMEIKPKHARQAEESCKVIERALVESQSVPPCLANPSTVMKRFLKSMVSHAHQAVRDASVRVLAEFVVRWGADSKECSPVLASLNKAKLKTIDERAKMRKASNVEVETVTLPERPSSTDLEDVSATQKTPPQKTMPFNEHRTLPKKGGILGKESEKKLSLVKTKLHGVIEATRFSHAEGVPKRRTPPVAVPGRCQFCGEQSEDFHNQEALLSHFFADCPMLCVCPLCQLPVEIREIHWHLSEDCQSRMLVKRCPRCLECVHNNEYNDHISKEACQIWSSTHFVCPLCHETLLADDIFWEAHILYPPFCSQNPRTMQTQGSSDDDSDEGAN